MNSGAFLKQRLVKNDYSVPYKSDEQNQQSSTDYYAFQERLLNLVPITEEELDEAEKFAAYCTNECRRSKKLWEAANYS